VENLPRAPASDLSLPDMLFVRPTLILVFDGLSDALFCVAPLWPGDTPPQRAIERADERIEDTLRRLAAPVPPSARNPDLPELALNPVLDPADYASMVDRAKEYITAGDIFQVVLAQ